ncbi:glycosyltransferase family 2 protein [Salinimicrobium sp. CAU 1759]
MVSIIIPTRNRSHLLGETLDSIIKQTWSNWECIVVDDNSQDSTKELIQFYSQKDSRIKLFSRPQDLLKGANSCRNYGFAKSRGDYIVWFDSDDLMTPDHVEVKAQALEATNSDFVIAKTRNFKGDDQHEPYYYEKKDYGIKASDFILSKIHWYTYDVMLSRSVAEKIEWNERMSSWQDYNYFCKMLLVTEKGFYIDKILTYRRIHDNSIQNTLTRTPENFNAEMLENRWLTYNDISDKVDFQTEKEMIFGMMNLCFELTRMKKSSKHIKRVDEIVEKRFSTKSKTYFKLARITGRLFKKGNFFLKKAKGK